jgi:N-acyl-D-amino-acid deacylase
MYDLVIRNGKIIDGSGAPAFTGDVAVSDGIIRAVGEVAQPGTREIDAGGHLVTPGFVDVHTHYDGQIIWDPQLESSALHGVTTIMIGNCGVGVAPARPGAEQLMMKVLEDVEDIPVDVLNAGIEWNWESFPEYLDTLDKQPRAIDVATQIAHIPLRCYVMGERGLRNEPASEQDIEQMHDLVKEALEAGALGFTTSRTELHVTGDGQVVPGTVAKVDELAGIARALKGTEGGIFGVVSDFKEWRTEMDWMKQISIDTGRPVYYLVVFREPGDYDKSREQLAYVREAAKEGAQLIPHVPTRPINMVMGFDSTYHPFCWHAGFAEIADLPYPQRLKKLQDPEVRKKILGDPQELFGDPTMMFPQEEVPCYEPTADKSVAAQAAREGVDVKELTYDLMLQDEGRQMLFYPVYGYDSGDLSVQKEFLEAEGTVVSLADGGAHNCILADASTPTYMLSYWTRDRERGERFTVEQVVKMQAADTARAIGLGDRGMLGVGMKADINIIDYDKIQIGKAQLRYDLPANGKRLFQGSQGYIATFVSGVLTYDAGAATGAMPGRLVRGNRSAPRAH